MALSEQPLQVLGLMSGTSMDGVDACLARIILTERRFEFEVLDSKTFPFEPDTRQAIAASLAGHSEQLAALHFRLGETFAQVATNFLDGRSVDLAGCHGQTVAHRDGQFTLQLGSAAPLARALGAPVVSGFREADLAAGGNGAPLMPWLDWQLWRFGEKGVATLNLGGVANISAIPPGGDREQVIGFDTGPGMGLIDEAARVLFDSPLDLDGQYSSKGVVQPALLAELLEHPFIRRKPPKSTGRDEFGPQLVAALIDRHRIAPADLLRTLVALTAKSVAFAIREFVKFQRSLNTLITSGGGVHHPVLMADLREELPGWHITDTREKGIDPDHKEALLMAALAVAHVQGLEGNLPGVTGAREPVVLGCLTPPGPGGEKGKGQ